MLSCFVVSARGFRTLPTPPWPVLSIPVFIAPPVTMLVSPVVVLEDGLVVVGLVVVGFVVVGFVVVGFVVGFVVVGLVVVGLVVAPLLMPLVSRPLVVSRLGAIAPGEVVVDVPVVSVIPAPAAPLVPCSLVTRIPDRAPWRRARCVVARAVVSVLVVAARPVVSVVPWAEHGTAASAAAAATARATLVRRDNMATS